jgi:hypothetical protein
VWVPLNIRQTTKGSIMTVIRTQKAKYTVEGVRVINGRVYITVGVHGDTQPLFQRR